MANKDLAQLLQLANVNAALSGPQVQQTELADKRRQSMADLALHILGLSQQAQQGEAERSAVAQYHQQLLGQQQSSEAQRGDEFTRELAQKGQVQDRLTQDAAAQRALEATHYKNQEQIQNDANTNDRTRNTLTGLGLIGRPGESSPDVTAAMRTLPGMEGFNSVIGAREASAHEEGIKWLMSQLKLLGGNTPTAEAGLRPYATHDPIPGGYEEAVSRLGYPAPTPTPTAPVQPSTQTSPNLRRGPLDGFLNSLQATTPRNLGPSQSAIVNLLHMIDPTFQGEKARRSELTKRGLPMTTANY